MKKFLCYDTNDAASGKINVSANSMLKPNSTVPSTNGASYQQLITDGSGNTKWEDRLAYEGSRLVVDIGDGAKVVKVADEVPSWASLDASIKVWISNGNSLTDTPEDYFDLGNGSFLAGGEAFFIAVDNTEFNNEAFSFVFPEKGVYFMVMPDDGYVSGVSSADSDTPEITWNGSLETIKKLDEKFLPECPVFTVQTKGTDKYLHDANGKRMTLEQAKTIGLNFVIQSEHGDGSLIKPISVVYDSVNARFYAVKLEDTFGDGITLKFNNYYAGEDVQNVE